MTSGRVFGILRVDGLTLADLEEWSREVFERAGGEGCEVSILVSATHVIAVDPELGDQLRDASELMAYAITMGRIRSAP